MNDPASNDAPKKPALPFVHEGYCDICDARSSFRAEFDWFRDHLQCVRCGSIPRERALMHVIKKFLPGYREMVVHESSPAERGASPKLANECRHYSASHYYPDLPLGSIDPQQGFRNEDLERLTLPDESIDLFVTQDVMEHIYDPVAVFKEIERVLTPGGAHVFTVPLINQEKQSVRWASRGEDGEVQFHFEPEFHGNPINPAGSPVTLHWGFDIADFISRSTGMSSTIVYIDNIDLGIRAEFIEVIISRKTSIQLSDL